MIGHFLEATAYAKKIGYTMVQAATNGIRFALEPEFAFQAKEAGFDMAYLQFDGITNEANAHRHISNLWDVRAQAVDNLHNAGIKITPVLTVINGINNDKVGEIVDFWAGRAAGDGGRAPGRPTLAGRADGQGLVRRHRVP